MGDKDTVRILGVEASIRASGKRDLVLSQIVEKDGLDQTTEFIYYFASEGTMSNTEGMLISALSGAAKEGAEIDLVYLHHKPEWAGENPDREGLAAYMKNYQGIVVSTPVYFGDRSSFTQGFFNSLAHMSTAALPLDGKTVGFLSVGAKRNGGQETTNIYGLYDAQSLGASVVGNGPPTSQYGGTGWAGDKGRILDDDFGLKTAFGTGSRVAQVSRIHSISPEVYPRKNLKIGILRFNEREELAKRIKEAVDDSGQQGVLYDIFKYKLKPCKGCRICPTPEPKYPEYPCLTIDVMRDLIARFEGIDCLIFTAELDHAFDGMETYQLFMERTRWVRRNHFMWTDLPVGIAVHEHADTLSAFPIRALTSCLRHNTFIVGPVYRSFRIGGQQMENPSLKNFIDRLIVAAGRSKYFRKVSRGGKKSVRYEAIGYESVVPKK